jgi:hypothetical protein
VLLERAPHGVAFVTGGGAQPGRQPWLAITRDDGATWRQSQLPCTFGIAGLRSPLVRRGRRRRERTQGGVRVV